MDYQTSKYFANKWGISERRVIKLCKDGRIDGAIRSSLTWMIPQNALKPADKRSKISKYLDIQKKVLIVNSDEKISEELNKHIETAGYQVENRKCKYTYRELKILFEQSETYYDGLILFYTENNGNVDAIENFIKIFAEKLHYLSSVVLVTSDSKKELKIVQELSSDLINQFGVRINAINIEANLKKELIINYDEIIQEIVILLTKLDNINGNVINTTANNVEIDSHGKSEMLDTGRFYRLNNFLYSKLKQDSYVWTSQIVMEVDWSEDSIETQYRKLVVQTSYQCNVEYILIVAHDELKYLKESTLFKIYENSNINTIVVDLDEITKKAPLLLVTLGNGWTGIDEDYLIVNDIKDSQTKGYVSTNKDIIKKSKDCFDKLKKYGKSIKEL